MSGALPANVMQFARVLRRAGLPIGPGKVLTAVEALDSISLARRDDLYWALHACFVERHAQSPLFDMAFQRFWRRPDGPDVDGPAMAVVDKIQAPDTAERTAPASRRIAEAFGDLIKTDGGATRDEAQDAVASWSATERLRQQDFETMSRDELDETARLIVRLRLPVPEVATRRYTPARSGPRIDMRATMRAMVRSGGALHLARRTQRRRRPPIVALCDISGSMVTYSRMLLRFLHALTNDRDRVYTFLFGTRLTNVTRELAHRDVDVALARVGRVVEDWGGGTRIGQSLADFNRRWSRRVLGQGAIVILITDGLDRDGGDGLSAEMDRLKKSCRRLLWLNPLLRFAGFEPKSAGIRAMLPHVHEFRPAHNIESLAELVEALSGRSAPGMTSAP